MQVELLAYTQANPALTPAQLAGVSDLATIFDGQSTYADNMIEFAGRVCYKSTHRMGTAPAFINGRVKEGHEDIIEHVVVTLRIRESQEPQNWRTINRHCEVTAQPDGSWIVSGNTRVWLAFFRMGIALEALPFLKAITPGVFGEFGDVAPAPLPELPPLAGVDLATLAVAEDLPMRVTLLGFTQPVMDDTGLLVDHGSATFFFEGISRACTHQLVRHRLASFSQESQRYVDLAKGEWGAVVPLAVLENPEARQILERAWAELQDNYLALRKLGIRKEDARFLLPNAAETRIVTTMNFAAWQHFLWLRAVDRAAQWEIRYMSQRVLEMLYAVAPTVFQAHWDVYQRDFVSAGVR